MDREQGSQELRRCANEIAQLVTSMHAHVPKLGHPTAQGEVIRALFELTKQVEVIKKQLLKLQKGDDSILT
jgi:hypothetical protein